MIVNMMNDTKNNSLLFLHLSDIHFHKRRSGTAIDIDEDLRHQLERDSQTVVRELGSVTAILVNGDIAFSGNDAEYETASGWLQTIAEKVDCRPPIILTVPGNHDVDRGAYENNLSLQMYQKNLRACSPQTLDSELTNYLTYPDAQTMLFEPLKNYNQFAAQYGCEINHKNLYWDRELTLGHNIAVRIRGVNSVLASNANDDSDPRKLCLGLRSVQVREEDHLIQLLLSHHPPDWLIDNDEVTSHLEARVHVQMFGHKHVQRVNAVNGKIRLAAGAVHPSRKEAGWMPRYNFLEFEALSAQRVRLRIYSRVWRETGFAADFTKEGSEYFEHFFDIAGARDVCRDSAEIGQTQASAENSLLLKEDSELAVEESAKIIDKGITLVNYATRDYGKILVRRFLSLDVYERQKIIRGLELDSPADGTSSDTDSYKTIFVRAKERHQLEHFWREVESVHNDGLFQNNPFTGS